MQAEEAKEQHRHAAEVEEHRLAELQLEVERAYADVVVALAANPEIMAENHTISFVS